jgi:aspartyl-tRNA(Asn)/glutamyl-tRNA(Gln) amidotransferase subunit C
VSLSKEQVQHIALLSRLRVGDADIDEVVAKLSGIVDFVDQLQAAPTDDVLPMAHPLDAAQRLRADEVTEVNEREQLQRNAPSVQDGLYLVPRVLE